MVDQELFDEGWIKVFRKIRKSILWQDKPFSKGQAWVDMLLMANHNGTQLLFGWEKIEIDRGQFITSQRQLALAWGWNRMRVRRFLELLQKCAQITTHQMTHKATLITIVNYDTYQGMQPTKWPTKRPTKRPTGDPLATTNKNDKNDKEEKESLKKPERYALPSSEEINEASIPKIKIDIQKSCKDLYERDVFPKANAFANKCLKLKYNPRAILHTLIRVNNAKPKEPWGYAVKIMQVEDGNFNERDFRKAT